LDAVAKDELTLTDQTFDEQLASTEQPVLVDFWAEWCGPCKMVAPILDEIVAEQDGKLRLGKVNIDDNMALARRFDVMSIPTMILFRDGEPKLRIVGAKGKGQLLQEISPYL
jgi:thioredoxin 1